MVSSFRTAERGDSVGHLFTAVTRDTIITLSSDAGLLSIIMAAAATSANRLLCRRLSPSLTSAAEAVSSTERLIRARAAFHRMLGVLDELGSTLCRCGSSSKSATRCKLGKRGRSGRKVGSSAMFVVDETVAP